MVTPFDVERLKAASLADTKMTFFCLPVAVFCACRKLAAATTIRVPTPNAINDFFMVLSHSLSLSGLAHSQSATVIHHGFTLCREEISVPSMWFTRRTRRMRLSKSTLFQARLVLALRR